MDRRIRAPEGAHRNALAGDIPNLDYTLRHGAVHALDIELAIIIAAADRLAAGHGLAHDDYTRLHQAHQFLIRILADLRGVEVTT